MAYFDSKLNSATSIELIVASIQSRLSGEDTMKRMMALTDLGVAVRTIGENPLEFKSLHPLVAEAAELILTSSDRGAAFHAALIFVTSPVASREFLPKLLQYLEESFPGREEPALRLHVLAAVTRSGVTSPEIERVLKLCLARAPDDGDELKNIKAALDELRPVESETFVVCDPRHEKVKSLLQARLEFMQKLAERSVAIVDDSGVDAFIKNFSPDLSQIFPMLMNCVRYWVEVQKRELPARIDRELVNLTKADIQQTKTAGPKGKVGKLKAFLA